MTIGFCKIGHKNSTFPKKILRQSLFATHGLGIDYDCEQVFKPLNVDRLSVLCYQPRELFQRLQIVRPGLGLNLFRDARPYRVGVRRFNPLQTNMVVPEGGEATAINAESNRSSREGFGDLTQIARLLSLDYILETLLLVVDQGSSKIKLIEELVPEDKIIKVMSELRRCDLIEIDDTLISPTPKAIEIVALLRTKLDNPTS
jgi:hypothetical protein